MIKFGSVCSGIEAASVAWNPLGWEAAWLAEIEPFPSAVLAHHYPEVPNLGDMTTLPARMASGQVEAPDIFCGGTPCQAFSVAGLRRSLDDARGNLSLIFCEIANAIDNVRADRGQHPSIVFWENVPGVLSTKDNAFGCLLAGLAGEDDQLIPPGGKWTNAGAVLGPKRAVAWRVLDAQYFGVAQRRRRVFVVASARDGFDPTAVLFEFDGLRRDTAPSREARQVSPTIPSRSTAGGGLGTDFDCDGGVIESFAIQAGALRTNPNSGPDGIGVQADHAYTLEARAEVQAVAFAENTRAEVRLEGGDGSRTGALCTGGGKPGQGVPCVAVAFPANLSGTQCASTENVAPALGAVNPTAVAFSCKDDGADASNDIAPTMRAMGHAGSHQNAGGHLAVAILQDVRGTDKAQNGRGWNDEGTAYTLDTHATQGVAYTTKLHNTGSNNAGKIFDERTTCLDANSPPPALLTAMQVRRLTPTECERLQGFPDSYTMIPWRKKPASECPDGPRYKALGNSWAVPVVAWIGKRIDAAIKSTNHQN